MAAALLAGVEAYTEEAEPTGSEQDATVTVRTEGISAPELEELDDCVTVTVRRRGADDAEPTGIEDEGTVIVRVEATEMVDVLEPGCRVTVRVLIDAAGQDEAPFVIVDAGIVTVPLEAVCVKVKV